MVNRSITRSKAFLSHLLLSLVILAVLTYLLTQHWYPGVFFHLDGGLDGLKLILGCDIVLGPLLTLIVFNREKKSLWLDLSIIGLIQLAALTAGTWIVYKERPFALAYTNDRFVTLLKANYDFYKIPLPNLSVLPGNYPKLIYVEMPADRKSQLKIKEETGLPLFLDAARYRPLKEHWQAALNRGGKTIAQMIQENPFAKSEIENWLHEHKRTAENTLMVPVSASASWRYLYVDRNVPVLLGVASRQIAPGV